VAREGIDVGYELCLSRARCRTADTAIEGDVKTSVPSLIGTNLQMTGPDGPIESRPVEMIECLVQFTSHGGHGRRPVAGFRQQGIDACQDPLIALGEGRNIRMHGHGVLGWIERSGLRCCAQIRDLCTYSIPGKAIPNGRVSSIQRAKSTGMETVIISAEDTIEMVSEALQKRYPSTVFAVRLEDKVDLEDAICGIDVIWVDGPSRDRVEDLVDRFQGVNWDPTTGALQSRSHFAVTPEGDLVRVLYNVDYIFCDGPMLAESC